MPKTWFGQQVDEQVYNYNLQVRAQIMNGMNDMIRQASGQNLNDQQKEVFLRNYMNSLGQALGQNPNACPDLNAGFFTNVDNRAQTLNQSYTQVAITSSVNLRSYM